MLVGGLGLGVGLLGLAVDRLLASEARLPVASQSASLPTHAPLPSLRAAPSGVPVAPIPAVVSVSAPEVVPLPSGVASLEPPAIPASNITGVPSPSPNAKPRIAPVARPALTAVKEPASGKPSSPASPGATGAETDLLDPY